MRAILMLLSLIVRDKVTKTEFTGHTVSRERRAETESNRGPSAYQSNALPVGPTRRLTLMPRWDYDLYSPALTDHHDGLV